MIPEGSDAVAVPADQTASVDWWFVFYYEMGLCRLPIVVSPLMAPGEIQVIKMENGQLRVVSHIRGIT